MVVDIPINCCVRLLHLVPYIALLTLRDAKYKEQFETSSLHDFFLEIIFRECVWDPKVWAEKWNFQVGNSLLLLQNYTILRALHSSLICYL